MTWHVLEVSILERFWAEESLQEGWGSSKVSSDGLCYLPSMSRGSQYSGWGQLRITHYQRGWRLNPGHRAGNGVVARRSGCPFPGLAAPATTDASPRTH